MNSGRFVKINKIDTPNYYFWKIWEQYFLRITDLQDNLHKDQTAFENSSRKLDALWHKKDKEDTFLAFF